MSYTYDLLDDNHILVLTLHSDCDVIAEMQQMMQEGTALADQCPAPIILISDTRQLYFSKLNAIFAAANAVRLVKPEDRLNRHPKVLKSFTVISSPTLKVAAKELNTASFGYINMTITDTLEEALERARELLREAGCDG